MTPTRLFEIACEDSKDILDLKEAVATIAAHRILFLLFRLKTDFR